MRFYVLLSLLVLLVFNHDIYAQTEKKIKNKKSKTTEIIADTNQVVTQTISGSYNVSIKFRHYYPYCGGAYPDESEMNNYVLLANSTFNLINKLDNSKIQVKTDSTGYLKIYLPPGKYGIQELFKDCTLNEFYERYKSKTTDSYTEEQGIDCYRSWWSSMLVDFEITDSTTYLKWRQRHFQLVSPEKIHACPISDLILRKNI